MLLNPVKAFIETAEFCHKMSFSADDETIFSVNHYHCSNDIFVQTF
jgi:hypothetical protein